MSFTSITTELNGTAKYRLLPSSMKFPHFSNLLKLFGKAFDCDFSLFLLKSICISPRNNPPYRKVAKRK